MNTVQGDVLYFHGLGFEYFDGLEGKGALQKTSK